MLKNRAASFFVCSKVGPDFPSVLFLPQRTMAVFGTTRKTSFPKIACCRGGVYIYYIYPHALLSRKSMCTNMSCLCSFWLIICGRY